MCSAKQQRESVKTLKENKSKIQEKIQNKRGIQCIFQSL